MGLDVKGVGHNHVKNLQQSGSMVSVQGVLHKLHRYGRLNWLRWNSKKVTAEANSSPQVAVQDPGRC
jgi:hypothetical protein